MDSGTVSYATVTDTAANLAANTGSYVTNGHHVTVTDTATVSQLNSIDALTNHAVTATISGTADVLDDLTGTNNAYNAYNAYTITVTDTVNLTQLGIIDSATSGTVTVQGITLTDGKDVIVLGSSDGGGVVVQTALVTTDGDTIALNGTGDHNITMADTTGAIENTFTIAQAQNGGSRISGLKTRDVIEFESGVMESAATGGDPSVDVDNTVWLAQVASGTVDNDGEWSFSNGTFIYWDDTAGVAETLMLTGVTILTVESNQFVVGVL
ncbi:hypothetical protein, partial [Candidatus Magnetobacterium casense]|uniref:hypothetical protein n=1 Tax=Candidatus Magnetobacterium casense TaxID=1455061 RepID=UPI0012DC8027